MAVYYLSNSGSDSNSGLSPKTPWKTIQKANETIAGGDTVCFCRGETFFGKILPPAQQDGGSPTSYRSYGEGPKPVISQYKTAKANAWEEAGADIWKLDLTDPSNFDGNTTDLDTNVGFLTVSGTIFPRNRFSQESLERQWDFWCDGRYVYVMSSGHPASHSDEIRIACNIHNIRSADNLCVEDLIFCGSGGFGMYGTAHHVTVRNCEFHDLGGAELKGFPVPHTRYGNGIECWSDSSDILVENCRFSGIYDVALTMQGNKVTSGWKNIVFRNNVIWNCQQCFEIWSEDGGPGTGFIHCAFEGNVCIGSGYCWSYDVRPDKTNACHLLMYKLECPLCDISVKNNTFCNARETPIYKWAGPGLIPEGYRIEENTFLTSPGQDLVFRGGCGEEVYRAFSEKLSAANRIFERAF